MHAVNGPCRIILAIIFIGLAPAMPRDASSVDARDRLPHLEADAAQVPLEAVTAAEASQRPRIATGDTVWIADWTFDLSEGACNDSGWLKFDNRILHDGSNYWVIDNRFDGTGGITGKAAILSKHDLFWVIHDGYGNDWDYSIICRYRGTGATLSFDFLSDSEIGADFVRVEADSAGASEALVNLAVDPRRTAKDFRDLLLQVDGLQNPGVVTALALPDYGVPSVIHEVYIRFVSDSEGSDEDGLYPSQWGAGLVVDDITVTGDLAYSEQFEGTLGADLTLANTANASPFGDWGRLYPHITDNSTCTENWTCAWLWSDPSLPAYSPSMDFGPGGAVVRNWLDDIIVSPWITPPAGGAGLTTVLSFRRFGGNTFDYGRIVQNWSVRSKVRVDNTDTSAPGDSIDGVGPWQHAASWNTLSGFDWGTVNVWLDSYLEPAAREIQVRFRVSDWQYISGAAPPTTLNPGPGPYLDRVRISRIGSAGPYIGESSRGTAQDMFPGSLQTVTCLSYTQSYYLPTLDRFGTCDFSPAGEIGWGECCPWVQCSARCDSIEFVVQDRRGAGGVASVQLYGAIVAGPHAGKAPPPYAVGPSGFFAVPVPRGTHCGTPSADLYTTDLDDEYFRGGDVLHYFVVATDNAGGFTSYPPGLAGLPASIAAAEAATGGLLEVSFLPSIDWDPAYLARIAAHPSGKLAPTPEEIANSHQRACMLYVNQRVNQPRSGDRNRTAFLHTLDRLGYRALCDVYDQNYFGGTTTNNQLAGRATIQQATGYALIVQDPGPDANYLTTLPIGGWIEGFYPQTQWYRDWLAQGALSEIGRATLWLIGNNIAEETAKVSNQLVFGDMGVTLVAKSQPTGLSPRVAGESSFTWADSAVTDFTGDSFQVIRYPCQTSFTNDGLGAASPAVLTHRYYQDATPGAGAIVMRANPAAHWNTILASFSWDDIRDPLGSPPGSQEDELAASILDAVLPAGCRAQRDLVTDAGPPPRGLPAVTRLHPNVPNPFNPVTAIVFDLHQGGRVKLQVFDVAGRLVRTLLDEPRAAGWGQRVMWNGQDGSGRRVTSGIYICVLSAPDQRATRKLVLLE